VPMNRDLASSVVERDRSLMKFNDMKGQNTEYVSGAICAERTH
jgi:hypothetical protein